MQRQYALIIREYKRFKLNCLRFNFFLIYNNDFVSYLTFFVMFI